MGFKEFLNEGAKKETFTEHDGSKLVLQTDGTSLYVRLNKEVFVIEGDDYEKAKKLFK